MDSKDILKKANDRTVLVDRLLAVLEKQLGTAQSSFLRAVLADVVEKFDTDSTGRIKNTTANKRLVALVDNVFSNYAKTDGLEVAGTMIDGISRLTKFNADYFSPMAEKTKLVKINQQVVDSIGNWLGIEDGKTARNGYLDTLIKDPTIKNKVKDLAMKAVVGQAGYNDTKKQLGNYLIGGDQKGSTGAMQSYYRNFVYDLYSQVDRTAAKITADKLQLNYAIYEGGLIETSRPFCIERNGKVFSRQEIAEFDPPTAKQPDYNPFVDLGGYGCRHHLNWIPDALAFAMRPELRDKKPTPAEVKSVEEPAASGRKNEIAPPIRPPKKTPFDKIQAVPPARYIPSAAQQKQINDAGKAQVKQDVAREKVNTLAASYNQLQWKANRTLDPKKREAILQEMNMVVGNYREANQKLQSITKSTQPTINKANNDLRNSLTKDLVPGDIKLPIVSPSLQSSQQFIKKLEESGDFFRKAAAGYLEGDSIGIRALKGTRAYQQGGDIVVATSTKPQTIVHELAHVLEQNNAVLKAAVDFWNQRTAGQQLKTLSAVNKAYGKNEMYKEGGFTNPYVGKIYLSRTGTGYQGISNTEIISMGLEYMYKQPAILYREDREYFNFIYTLFFNR